MFGRGGEDAATSGERLQRLRRRSLLVLTLVFLTFQLVLERSGDNPGLALGGSLKLPAFIVWAAVLLVALCVTGGRFLGREHRGAMNDELTRRNRSAALAVGFWVALLTAAGMYFATMVETVTAREVLRVVITMAVSGAIAAFVFLEERADRAR